MSSASTKSRSRSSTKSATKRKSAGAESPARAVSIKKTKTTSRTRTPSRTRSTPTATTTTTTTIVARKTPVKRKATAAARSSSKKRKEEEEEEDDGEEEDEDEDMEGEGEEEDDEEEEEAGGKQQSQKDERNGVATAQSVFDHAGLSIRGISAKVHQVADVARERVGALGALVPQAREAAQHAREGLQHVRQSATSRVSEARSEVRSQLQHARETVDKAYEDVKEQVGRVVHRSSSRKGKQQEEGEEEEEEDKAAPKRRRSGAASQPQRRSSRINAQQQSSHGAGEDDEVTERNGVLLHTHKADVSHLTQYHPDGTVIESWRDVLQVLPHLLLHIAAIIALHVFVASVEHDRFAGHLYEYLRPRTLRNILLSRQTYFLALKSFKAFMLHYPAVLAGFFATTYFFRASVRSILLRHADATLKDCDYHSGAFTGYFSRMVFGVVHMAFVYLFWDRFTSGTNIMDLSIVFWINLAYWAQDALANAVYRSESQTNVQVAASYLMLWTSLIFSVVQTPVPVWFEPWHVLLRPTALVLLLLAVFVQSLMSASHLIHAHSDFDSRIKMAAWGLIFVVYIPLTVAFVIVPALGSYSDIIFHYEFPLKAYLPGHYKYTELPHKQGDPTHKHLP